MKHSMESVRWWWNAWESEKNANHVIMFGFFSSKSSPLTSSSPSSSLWNEIYIYTYVFFRSIFIASSMVTANSTCVLDECEYMWHITDGFRFVLPARCHSRYKIFFPDSTLLFMWADADEMQTPVLTATNNGGARYSSTRAIHAISVWVRSIFNGCCENIYICMKKPGDAIYLYWLRMRLDGTQTQRTRCHKFVTTWQQNTLFLSQEWEWERERGRVVCFTLLSGRHTDHVRILFRLFRCSTMISRCRLIHLSRVCHFMFVAVVADLDHHRSTTHISI